MADAMAAFLAKKKAEKKAKPKRQKLRVDDLAATLDKAAALEAEAENERIAREEAEREAQAVADVKALQETQPDDEWNDNQPIEVMSKIADINDAKEDDDGADTEDVLERPECDDDLEAMNADKMKPRTWNVKTDKEANKENSEMKKVDPDVSTAVESTPATAGAAEPAKFVPSALRASGGAKAWNEPKVDTSNVEQFPSLGDAEQINQKQKEAERERERQRRDELARAAEISALKAERAKADAEKLRAKKAIEEAELEASKARAKAKALELEEKAKAAKQAQAVENPEPAGNATPTTDNTRTTYMPPSNPFGAAKPGASPATPIDAPARPTPAGGSVWERGTAMVPKPAPPSSASDSGPWRRSQQSPMPAAAPPQRSSPADSMSWRSTTMPQKPPAADTVGAAGVPKRQAYVPPSARQEMAKPAPTNNRFDALAGP